MFLALKILKRDQSKDKQIFSLERIWERQVYYFDATDTGSLRIKKLFPGVGSSGLLLNH